MNRIYLDYNATTPLDPGVRDVFFSALDLYANASSMHEDGRHAAAQMEQARRQEDFTASFAIISRHCARFHSS